MQSSDLVSSFGEIARAKDIDRDTLQLIVEDVFRAMIEKRYGADDAFEIIFNPSEGDIQILHIREVVEDWDLEDPVTQIEVSDAKEIDDFFEVGEEVATELRVGDFGRRAVMTARQTFRQEIRDIEKEHIYEEYSELVGEIVVGEIYQTRRGQVFLMKDEVEMLLPREEQIPREHYRKGDMLRAVVKEVMRDAGTDPQVILSRKEEVFMERLFELEVPEVYEGLVEIKKIARIPGDRAKVAVESHDERVDPVGACVGVKGVRIHAVVRELDNENIDVLLWDDNPNQLIVNALSPANPVGVSINEEADPPRAKVDVPSDEVSQAIGRRGVNIRLASKLTGYEIDVYRDIPEDEEDIEIEEFGDALAPETIERLQTIGCDTGKAVLELSVDELSRRSGLARDTAERVVEIIETEFARGPSVMTHLFDQEFVLEAPGTTLEESDVSLPEAEEDRAEVPEGAAAERPAPAAGPAAAEASLPAEVDPRQEAAPAVTAEVDTAEAEEHDETEEVNNESVSGASDRENASPAASVGEEPSEKEAAPEDTPAEEEAAAPEATPAPNVTPDPEEAPEEPAEKSTA